MNNSTEFPIIIGTNKDNYSLYDYIADYNYRNSEIIINAKKHNKKSIAIISQKTYNSDNEPTFSELYDYYNNIISEIKSMNYSMIYAKGFTSLSHMRVCTIICKENNIPIILTKLIDDYEKNITDTSLTSFIITLQSLGAYSVGFSCDLSHNTIHKILKRLFHHTEVPITLDIPCSSFSNKLIKDRGGSVFFLNESYKNCEYNIISEIRNEKVRKKDFTDSYAASIYDEVFFLNDYITLTQKIYCSINLSDILIDYEDEMVNALLVCITNKDDADYLIEALPFVKLPVAINCHEPDILEYVLKRFNGRAIVDSTSDMNETKLKEISNKYGAIIY